MKKIMNFSLIMIALIALSACTNKNELVNGTEERHEVSVSFNVTSGANQNETGNGWTGGSVQEVTKTFLTNPSRVAIFSYDALDIIDFAGIEKTSIKMLGFPKNNLPTYLNQYNQEMYFNLGTLFIPDWDALDLFQPELIILGSRSSGAYDRLNQQFPNADILDMTMVYGEYSEGLDRNIENLSKIFPTIKNELDNALNDIDIKMNNIKMVANAYNALFIMVNGESLSFYGENGRFAVLYDEFGFLSADQNQEGGSHGNVVGYEYVKMVNPQVLFLLDRGLATGGSSTIEFVIENQLIKDTDAGINDHIYTLDPEAWYISTGGIKSTYQMIEDLLIFINKM